MAKGITTESDVKKSIENLSNELDTVFKKIQSDAFKLFDGLATSNLGFTKGFKDAVKEINNMSSIADRYNGYAKLSETIQSKIVELKSKSGYLDSLSLEFKQAELDLQKQITTAQISRLLRSASLDNAAKKEAIDTLKVKMIMADAELDYLQKNSDKQNEIIEKLERIKKKIKDISPELEKERGVLAGITSFYNDIKRENEVIFYFASKIFAAFTSIEDASFEVRKNLGLIGKEGDKFKTLITDSYVRFANLGVTAETVGKTINSIANGLGSSQLVTQQMVENFSVIETSLGISAEQSVKVSRSLAGISKSSSMSQSSMIGFVKELSRAAGTSLAKVMEDLAGLTESVRLTFRGSTVQLIKATVEARRLGLSINEVASVAEKLLDFQESINAEIEASVMMGKNISFNDARVLAYRGDILGATKQILDTVEKTTDLNQVDYFTLKAIAASTGLTVDKLQDSLQLRKDLRLVESMGTKEARDQAALYKSLNNMSDSFAKSAGEQALENIKNTNNLALQKQLQAELNGLVLQLGQLFLPVLQFVGKIVSGLTFINNWLRENLGETGKWVSAIGLVSIGVVVMKAKWGELFSMMLGKWPKIQSMLNFFTGAGGAAGAAGSATKFGKGAMFSGIGSFLKSIGTGLGLMGAAASLYILAKAIKEFPTDLGGLSIGEYMRDMAGGLLYLGLAFGILGVAFEAIIPGAGVLVIMSAALVVFAGAMNETGLAIKVFADSFAKLTENLNIENLLNIKNGAVAVKEAMSEIRGELNKFSKDDLNVLDKLGNLKANITAGIKGENITGKESANATMAETIKSAVVEGMRQVKITINLDGRAVGMGVASSIAINDPAGVYNISTKQGR